MPTEPTRLVQLIRRSGSASEERRIALVAEPDLICLVSFPSVYDLVQSCLANEQSLTAQVHALATGERIPYDSVYNGQSTWSLLPPIDVPGQPSRVLVAGTGLTHLGSARQRQAMHRNGESEEPSATVQDEPVITDSMRMFQWGVESGRPPEGVVGVAPEWFFKGDASIIRAPFQPLAIPGHAEDGGEEAELAGIYLIAQNGTPYRIGITQGNEFSDHKFEKHNYLNLAGSKLRTCSLGPELVLDASFDDVAGEVSVRRGRSLLWHKQIASGEANMCHSLRNLEHHHFKFDGHRQPGSVHVHFFGADALSFGAGITLAEGDVAEVSFQGFGRPLRNPIRVEAPLTAPIHVRSLA